VYWINVAKDNIAFVNTVMSLPNSITVAISLRRTHSLQVDGRIDRQLGN
jgi:hypothetical protein